MTAILGCDPGNNGAIAILDPEKGLMRITDMPVFEYETTRARIRVDPYGVARICSAQPLACAYVEEVNASPQMGTVSAFSFGRGFGVLEGVLAAREISLTTVKPTNWKKQMRVPADKKASVQRASQLFPRLAHLFKGPKGGILDGRAEAALMAMFGAIELGRTPTKPVEVWM